MKRIVLIDGENLVYGIRHLLGANGQLADRSVVNGFQFRGLIEELLQDNLPTQILWFGARLRIYDQSEEIKIKSESAVRQQSHFVNDIQKQQIQFIKVGYLRAREVETAGQPNSWKLVEKGVDVGLAVRVVTEAAPETEIVIISADTDLLPAFKAASKLGSKIMHIGYEFRPVAALSRTSNATRTITIPLVNKYKA
jgi:uncharacterized LabA/DUF88 family protein